jgi:hypothetical protein
MPMSSQTSSAADGTAGLGGLREEVSTCEYHDVHVMWEMLSAGGGNSSSNTGGKSSTSTSKPTKKKGRRGSLPVVAWSRLLSYCCGAL